MVLNYRLLEYFMNVDHHFIKISVNYLSIKLHLLYKLQCCILGAFCIFCIPKTKCYGVHTYQVVGTSDW